MGSDRAHFDAGDAPSTREDAATRLSRRQVLRRGAVAVGGMTGLGLIDPASVLGWSSTAAPRPIPGGLSLENGFVPSGADFHFLLPGIGFEMSTITDFAGIVGGSETRGFAYDDTKKKNQYSFDCDMRFMQGLYIGLDGRRHFGSFGFV